MVVQKKRGPYAISSIYPLSPTLQRHQKIRVDDAARLNAMDPNTFQKRYGHLIRRVSDRIRVVELGDAIDLPDP